MPIPQPIDYKLAEIESFAANVSTALRILRGGGPERDVSNVREWTQRYANLVMETAHEIVNSKK